MKQKLILSPEVEEEIAKLAKGTDQESLEKPTVATDSVKINIVDLDLVINHESKKIKEGEKENEEPTEERTRRNNLQSEQNQESDRRSATVSRTKRYTII